MSEQLHPPRMEDLHALAMAAVVLPLEAEAQLAALRHELAERIAVDPEAVADFALVVEHGRRMVNRQLEVALRLLSERQTCIELHQCRDREHLAEIRRLREAMERVKRPAAWWEWWRR